ncbi:MAG: 50S ribosomal protein L11 methyltransferase [Bdellovibrionota bacterium]|nr:50S ribosomal protein L11 methyltransferase [Bdellovibrionota bacterium]
MSVDTGEFLVVKVKLTDPAVIEEVKEIAFGKYDADGIQEFAIDEARVDEILGERAYSGGDVPEEVIDEVSDITTETNDFDYSFYFFNGDITRGEGFSKAVVSLDGVESCEVENQEYSDWNAEWRKHYKPIDVKSDFKVIPEWFKEDNYKSDKENIYINPGMGFGTGEHETTFLCLSLFDDVKSEFSHGSLCLDFGCGSGILGIGAMKKARMLVDFVDIDPRALDNCLTNLKLNFEESELNGLRLISRDRFELSDKYKLVFANILEHVLISEKELLLDSLDSKGYLILSGILNHQVDNIKSQYESLIYLDHISKGDWSAIIFKKG